VARRVPVVGAEVTVVYLNARETGVVEAVEDGGTTAVVVTEHAEVLRFHLTATGAFVTPDHTCRLRLD
jgi:hypothetical protein